MTSCRNWVFIQSRAKFATGITEEGIQMSRYLTVEAKARHAEQQRSYRLRNPERCKEITNAYRKRSGQYKKYGRTFRERNPAKCAAHRAVYHAVESGRLVRPSYCDECNRPCKPHGHHPDYNKPLEVIWLCWACHLAVHGRTPRIASPRENQYAKVKT